MKRLLKQSGHGLNHLIEQTQLYEALLSLGKEQLPPRLAQHLIGVSFKGQTLVLQLDDALWRSKFRFYELELLALYQQNFPHLQLSRVEIHVIPISEPKRPKKQKMAPPDKESGAALCRLSEQVENPGLKKVLQRLGARAFEKEE